MPSLTHIITGTKKVLTVSNRRRHKTFDILAGIRTPNLTLFIHTPSMAGIPALGQAPVSRKRSFLTRSRKRLSFAEFICVRRAQICARERTTSCHQHRRRDAKRPTPIDVGLSSTRTMNQRDESGRESWRVPQIPTLKLKIIDPEFTRDNDKSCFGDRRVSYY